MAAAHGDIFVADRRRMALAHCDTRSIAFRHNMLWRVARGKGIESKRHVIDDRCSPSCCLDLPGESEIAASRVKVSMARLHRRWRQRDNGNHDSMLRNQDLQAKNTMERTATLFSLRDGNPDRDPRDHLVIQSLHEVSTHIAAQT